MKGRWIRTLLHTTLACIPSNVPICAAQTQRNKFMMIDMVIIWKCHFSVGKFFEKAEVEKKNVRNDV